MSLDLREIGRARPAGLRILFPSFGIVETEVHKMLGELAVEVLVRIHKLHRISRRRVWRRFTLRSRAGRISISRSGIDARSWFGERRRPRHVGRHDNSSR